MILECQRDSYKKKFTTTVKSVNKKDNASVYEVELEDTILFPEGGGQPSDAGTINGIPLLDVKKVKGSVIHTLGEPLTQGDTVNLEVNWTRRFDHMQQHSGQHLLSAVAETLLGYKTTSWYLGEEVSFVELDTPSMKDEEIKKLENFLNDRILDGNNLKVNYYKPSDPELLKVVTRLEIPEEEKGNLIRVVTIEGIDNNTCCGTHVSNLSQLQSVKLLYAEKGKKDKTNLHFVFGGRVLKYLGTCLDRERKETTLLKCNPRDHVDMIEKIQTQLKVANKKNVVLSKELAILEASFFKTLDPKPKYYSFHKQEVGADFLSLFANEVNDKSVVLFLTCGDPKGSGQLLLNGPPEVVDIAGPKVCDILEGKGNGKNGKFQGKVNKLSQRKKADEFLKNLLHL